MITEELAFEQTKDYFNQDELAAKVFIDKYALRNKEGEILELTPDDMHRRMAKEFARIQKDKYTHLNEKDAIQPLSEEDIYQLFKNFKYIIPQGSPMFGIGNNFQDVSLSNCFVLTTPQDSYGSILDTDLEIVQISKRRGGVGIEMSNLRPKGAFTNNAAKTTTGVISFMERYSNSIREVGQNGRRGALMLTLSCHHPDIEEFITVKNDRTKITGANISIRLSDEFLQAVENNEEYELRFPIDKKLPTKISKKVSAKKIWDLIISNARNHAEPGVLFWDKIIEYSPADSYKDFGFETVSTNPCGEIPLSNLDACRLMIVNLLSYIKNPFTSEAYFDEELFSTHTVLAQRLMDDLIDLEVEKIDSIIKKIKTDDVKLFDNLDEYQAKIFLATKKREIDIWEKIKDNAVKGRRTGLGITALGDMFAALNIPYGSDESIQKADEIFKLFRDNAYLSSIEMAKELGAFPIYNKKLEINNSYINNIKELSPEIYSEMEKYGRRNISILTCAPTGSTSILAQTTSGLEPLFMMSYTRRKKIVENDNSKNTIDFVDQNNDKWTEFKVHHSQILRWMEITNETDENKSPWANSTAEEIDWEARVKLQSSIQKYIDHSISSTVNLPENITEEEVNKIFLKAWKSGCKGITIYRKNSRTGVLVEEQKEIKNEFKKRPKELKADVHHFKIKEKDYYVTVGLLNNQPYEIFIGENHEDEEAEKEIKYRIPKKVKEGTIRKIKRGMYDLYTNDNNFYRLSGNIEDSDLDALTRMISISLRHEVHVSFIVQQLEKIVGFDNFPKALGKALKKYIKDGTKVSGDTCMSCNSQKLIRQDGCVTCVDCGWSKC